MRLLAVTIVLARTQQLGRIDSSRAARRHERCDGANDDEGQRDHAIDPHVGVSDTKQQ